jgi:callose synthase
LGDRNSSLRVAYIDIVETTKDRKTTTSYYSKLVKAGPSGKDETIYSIKLPGEVRLGEGKPENQNHAIIFTRGDAIQTIDMNQVSGGAFLQLLACPEISVNVFAQVMLLQLFI